MTALTDRSEDDGARLLDEMRIPVPDREHALRCARFAAQIFDALHGRLGLDERDREIAVVAALFHDAGYLRGARDHHRKSFDIIREARLPSFNEDDRLVAACAARYHGHVSPNIEHAGFGTMSFAEQRRVRRVSGIVRLAVALDASHLGVIRDIDVTAGENDVTVRAFAAVEPAVERERLRESAGGFSGLTQVPVRVEIVVNGTSVAR